MSGDLKYLLDTNILSELIRHPRGGVAQHIERVGERSVCTSIVVAAELRFGAAKKASPRLTQQMNAVLDLIAILPLETPMDEHCGQVRLYLERRGQPFGPNDLLIAAHAQSLGLTVVTANTTEFRRVPGLPVENWLE